MKQSRVPLPTEQELRTSASFCAGSIWGIIGGISTVTVFTRFAVPPDQPGSPA